jgi:hypothetical protein
VFILICFFIECDAQIFRFRPKGKRNFGNRTSVLPNGIYLSLNPFAFAEPRASAIGLGVAYRFDDRLEICNELSVLRESIHNEPAFENVNGFRNIFATKYSIFNNEFIGAEFRIRNYSFSPKADFYNASSGDTLKDFRYKAKYSIFGVAFIFGRKFKLSRNNKLQLEISLGVGGREKATRRWAVPNGYVSSQNSYPKIFPGTTNNFERGFHSMYFPAALKLFYKL